MQTTPTSLGAWPALTRLRGVALLSMLAMHGLTWTIPRSTYLAQGSSTWLRLADSFMWVGALALLPPAIAAATFPAWSERQGRRKTLMVLLALLPLGWRCGVLLHGWEAAALWDPLLFIAVSLSLCAIFPRAAALVGLAVGGWVISALFSPGPSNSIGLTILFGAGKFFTTWPLLPYFPLVVMGWLSGKFRVQRSHTLWGIGGLLALAGFAYPPSRELALHPRLWDARSVESHLGVCLFAGAYYWIGLAIAGLKFWERFRWERVICGWGRGILWGYVSHLSLGLTLTRWAAGLWPEHAVFIGLFFSVTTGILGAQLGENLGSRRVHFVLRRRVTA